MEQPDILTIHGHEGSLIAELREIAEQVRRDVYAFAQKLHVYCNQVLPRIESK